MNVKIEKNTLTITVPDLARAIKDARLSASGKTRVLAGTRGFEPAGKFEGVDISFNLNITVRA